MTRDEFETLGDKHKRYEKLNRQVFIPGLPIMVRLDGRAFHTFTKGLERPYDARMSACMANTAVKLIKETNALIAYTQSDEISLILPARYEFGEMLFDGSKSKIESILASIASVEFNKQIAQLIPEKIDESPVFDCRTWQYPTDSLYIDCLYWREMDATRNSLSMACSALYSQKELNGVGRARRHDMLYEKGINWNDYPEFFKRGQYFAKRSIKSEMDDETWNKIPEKNRPLTRIFTRSVVMCLSLPPINKIDNMYDVVFFGEDAYILSDIQ